MMLHSKMKTYLHGDTIIVLKNGDLYEGKLTYDDHIQLNKTKYKNVKSIYYNDYFRKVRLTYDAKRSDDIVKRKIHQGYEIYLTKEKYIFSVGINDVGQLGLGDNIQRMKPERISLPNVIKFWNGIDNSCALTDKGFYTWGQYIVGLIMIIFQN